jgi:hypothetical protein
VAEKMLTKHRRIYREELQICVWLGVWDKNQTHLQGGESGIGRPIPDSPYCKYVCYMMYTPAYFNEQKDLQNSQITYLLAL